MQEFKADRLIHLGIELGRLAEHLSNVAAGEIHQEENRKSDANAFEDHEKEFTQLGLKLCARQCSRLISFCRDTEPGLVSDYVRLLKDLQLRMSDECEIFNFISLTQEEASFYTPTVALFGENFAANFPSAAFELDEAAKCLALGRSTAAVFHLMRILEIGVRALARALSIPNPTKPVEKNWGIILKKVWEEGIEKRWPKAADRTSGDGYIFESLYASLDAVKNPWRNSTMHVENKYTPDEAQHIYSVVRGFMRKLASRVDENGEPRVP